MNKAIYEDLIGYMPGEYTDIIFASTGELDKRYGFIYVDYQDDGSGSGDRLKKIHSIGIRRLSIAMGVSYEEETASILKTITPLYISKAFSLLRKISKNI